MRRLRVVGVMILTAVMLAVALVPGSAVHAATKGRYDGAKAVSYAQTNWNKNKGRQCAEFAAECVRAGGIPINPEKNKVVSTLKKSLGGLGSYQSVNVSGGQVKASSNAGKLQAGDLVFYSCSKHGLKHVSVAAGFDAKGYARIFQHNPSRNYTLLKSFACKNCGKTLKLYSFHFHRDFSGVAFSSIPDQAYTGSSLQPAVTLSAKEFRATSGVMRKEQGKVYTLKKDVDYTVSYSNNKYPGVGSVTVVGKGAYAGCTRTLTFNIKIKAPSISKVTTKEKFLWLDHTLKWNPSVKSNTGITGYEILISSSSKFTSSQKYTVKKVQTATMRYVLQTPNLFTKLRSGTCYIKMRSFVTVGKKTYYSPYSAVKTAPW